MIVWQFSFGVFDKRKTFRGLPWCGCWQRDSLVGILFYSQAYRHSGCSTQSNLAPDRIRWNKAARSLVMRNSRSVSRRYDRTIQMESEKIYSFISIFLSYFSQSNLTEKFFEDLLQFLMHLRITHWEIVRSSAIRYDTLLGDSLWLLWLPDKLYGLRLSGRTLGEFLV